MMMMIRTFCRPQTIIKMQNLTKFKNKTNFLGFFGIGSGLLTVVNDFVDKTLAK